MAYISQFSDRAGIEKIHSQISHCTGGLYVNLTQAMESSEQENLAEEMPP